MEDYSTVLFKRATALFVLSLCAVAYHAEAVKQPAQAIASVVPHHFANSSSKKTPGRELVLVEPPQIVLNYHNGPLLTAGPVVPIYLIWYGSFSAAQRGTILEFFASFDVKKPVSAPSVGSWWKLTSGYKDSKGTPVAPSFGVAGQITLAVGKGKSLSVSALQSLVVRSLKKLPAKWNALYVVLTASDIQVEDFCMNSCASHFVSNKTITKGLNLPYIWVGNPASQCPGLCAWPYAKPEYGPPDFTPLGSPNNDVGIDGMIINLGSMLAGVATNPFDTGFYQGDESDPLEAATACTGTYGTGAYSGYPGQLLVDPKTKASYNTNGVNNRKFLMPGLWNPKNKLCTPP